MAHKNFQKIGQPTEVDPLSLPDQPHETKTCQRFTRGNEMRCKKEWIRNGDRKEDISQGRSKEAGSESEDGDGVSPRNVVLCNHLTRLIVREDFIKSCRRESFKSYIRLYSLHSVLVTVITPRAKPYTHQMRVRPWS